MNEGKERTREASHCIFTRIGYFADERMPGIIEIGTRISIHEGTLVAADYDYLRDFTLVPMWFLRHTLEGREVGGMVVVQDVLGYGR